MSVTASGTAQGLQGLRPPCGTVEHIDVVESRLNLSLGLPMAVLHQELLLDLNADCAEFCPSPEQPDLLAVGTYQLDEATTTRIGQLYLYALQGLAAGQAPHLQVVGTAQLSGIFDVKWWQAQPQSWQISLALADGTLSVLQHIQETNPQAAAAAAEALVSACSCQAVSSGMALSLDWSHCGSRAEQQAVVSSSSGHLSLVQAAEGGLTVMSEWQAHDLEAWVATFDYWHPDVVYSGADDSAFKVWDVRAPPEQPACANRKGHGAGVCCIASHPLQEHVLCTGSYDERARLWDTRQVQRPMQLAEVDAGGGVWRLKWHPTKRGLLLAACMYGGFAVLHADAAFASLAVAERYGGHDSIAYGADWYRAGHRAGDAQATGASGPVAGARRAGLVATCSFYDKRLHLWSTAMHADAER